MIQVLTRDNFFVEHGWRKSVLLQLPRFVGCGEGCPCIQLRRLILNENEHGFRKLRRPIYLEYEESGLEKTRQVLNDKIHQLNSVIDSVSSSVMDNVSSRLKGWKGKDGIEIDSEAEAAM
ncbi:hypothetical protein ACLOJK_027346 [Asimina triloba]